VDRPITASRFRQEGRGILTQARDAAERVHGLGNRTMTIGLGLEPILLQQPEISLCDTEGRPQIVDEQVQCLLGLDGGIG
jgi:hypothetical protein